MSARYSIYWKITRELTFAWFEAPAGFACHISCTKNKMHVWHHVSGVWGGHD